MQNSTTPRSRTPTPRIESTSHEPGDSPSASGTRAETVSPAASEEHCVKYNTSDLSDTAATTAASSDGIIPVHDDSVFTSEAGDLSGALSGWPDMKDNLVTESSDNMTCESHQSGWCCSVIIIIILRSIMTADLCSYLLTLLCQKTRNTSIQLA